MANPDGLPRWNRDRALFPDVDGTLLEIADRPDAVRGSPRLKLLLRRALLYLDDCVALVSGRPIVELDWLFAPLVRHRLMEFARAHAGMLMLDKAAALALHYRNAPHKRTASAELIAGLADAAGGRISHPAR